ncbi:Urea ABC transporter, substrate binding protein UrtA [Caenispirillum salinarum AK4]|uniref:Urea ABC transporter, substrate binding protein UrtA n=1 Tax=Caenispirillum salinarum AK4 TaxID=1238182 RepID=K9HG42_9PROT|nr:urea ABC transporter substrate-binding protein [Caenispirillum salinarum]EKV27591.1 Urea ABC transporter, substrate binding protein UrtA [Caenispirillum salinarum AK4]
MTGESHARKVLAPRHRYYVGAVLAALVGIVVALTLPAVLGLEGLRAKTPIRVGVLHSLSGTMAVSERPVAEATLFAISEINRAGGVLGRPIEPILVDGASDWDAFAREAERLISHKKVSAIFGCWTSACRKTVKPVFERLDHVLFYPVQYEGLEQSPNIVYTGAAPNQQIIPATKWALDNLGRRIFLVGSDYVFPRTAHAIIRAQVGALNGEIAGEAYRPLGATDFGPVIEAIKAAKPDVIFNTINGDSNLAFYKALRAAGVTPEAIPVMSFSLAETEVRAIGPALVEGDYAARNYFRTVDTPENAAFKAGFRARYGAGQATTAPMEAAYFGVHLWAQAVTEARSEAWHDYRARLLGQSLKAPSGIIYLDPITRHTWRPVLIGRARADGDFDIVWSSGRPVRPIPFPGLRSRPEWGAFLDSLRDGWGGRWAAPGPDVAALRDGGEARP